MAPRRWLLLALSLASLVVMSYGAIAVALSVPITQEMAEANSLGDNTPAQGDRAAVRPLVNPGDVATWHRDGEGTWLIVNDRPVMMPVLAENVELVGAMAYVSVLHDGTYREPEIVLTNLTALDENGETVTFNETVNVTAMAAGKDGFFVKTANGRDLRFVATRNVVGAVERFESAAWSYGLVIFGSLGFVAPLVVLMLTARPTGTPGVKSARGPAAAAGAACPECRRPLPGNADFCTSCGAWVPGKDS